MWVCSQCSEKCVMNNYFGIGLDAKISLEFNNKRDEHPKKCRQDAIHTQYTYTPYTDTYTHYANNTHTIHIYTHTHNAHNTHNSHKIYT